MKYIEILSALQDKQIEAIEKRWPISIHVDTTYTENAENYLSIYLHVEKGMIGNAGFWKNDIYGTNDIEFNNILKVIETAVRQGK